MCETQTQTQPQPQGQVFFAVTKRVEICLCGEHLATVSTDGGPPEVCYRKKLLPAVRAALGSEPKKRGPRAKKTAPAANK